MSCDTPAPVAQPLSAEEASLALSALEQAIDSSLPRSMNVTITKALGKALANAVSLYLSDVPRAVPPAGAIGNDADSADADVGQSDFQPFGAGLGDMVGPSSVESPGSSHATPVGAGHGPLASVPDGEAALGASSRFHDASVTRGVNLAAAPDEGLDVERLALALVTAVRSERAPIGYKGDGWPAYWEKDRPATVLRVNSLAEAIAAEYARLQSEAPADGSLPLPAHRPPEDV